MSMLPPWLLPEIRSSHLGKVVVFATDPRFSLMRTGQLYSRLALWTSDGEDYSAVLDQLKDAQFFLKAYFEGAHVAGEVMQRLTCWARQERRHPDRVKIVFLEDFLRHPDAAFKSLAHFLGASSEVSESAVTHFKATQIFADSWSGLDDIFHMSRHAEDFEQCMRSMPAHIQRSWTEKVEMLALESSDRMAELCNCLQRHSVWSEPKWKVPHSLGVCKPCTFAARGKCWNVECGFCHELGHPHSKRLSQKERRRRVRRHNACDRTPSPQGLPTGQTEVRILLPTMVPALVPVVSVVVQFPWQPQWS